MEDSTRKSALRLCLNAHHNTCGNPHSRCAAPLSLPTFDVAPRSGLLYPPNQPSYIGMQDGNGHANPSKQSAKGQSVAFLTSTRRAIRSTVWAFPNCRATMHQETPFELGGILFDPKPFAILRMHVPRTRDLFPHMRLEKKRTKTINAPHLTS